MHRSLESGQYTNCTWRYMYCHLIQQLISYCVLNPWPRCIIAWPMLVVCSSIVKHVLMSRESLDLQTTNFASILVMDIHMLLKSVIMTSRRPLLIFKSKVTETFSTNNFSDWLLDNAWKYSPRTWYSGIGLISNTKQMCFTTVAQWAVRLTRSVSVVGLSPIKGPCCFLQF